MEIVDLAMKDDKHGDFPVRYLSLHCTSLHFTLAFWNVGTIHSPTQTIRSFFSSRHIPNSRDCQGHLDRKIQSQDRRPKFQAMSRFFCWFSMFFFYLGKTNWLVDELCWWLEKTKNGGKLKMNQLLQRLMRSGKLHGTIAPNLRTMNLRRTTGSEALFGR